jgi:hypothetical protein
MSYSSFDRRGPVADFLQTAKIGSLADVNDSQDAEGLRVFYYLVQDLKVGSLPAYSQRIPLVRL